MNQSFFSYHFGSHREEVQSLQKVPLIHQMDFRRFFLPILTDAATGGGGSKGDGNVLVPMEINLILCLPCLSCLKKGSRIGYIRWSWKVTGNRLASKRETPFICRDSRRLFGCSFQE